MPWKESTEVNERAKFVLRHDDGEKMTDLCREFGISRKTGHKIYKRYKENGMLALYSQKRGPKRAANLTPLHIQDLILKSKKNRPTWGAPKLKAWLDKKYPTEKIPVKSTIHAILDRNDLVKSRRKKTKYVASPTNLSHPNNPNDLWCVDFKGQFRLQNRTYCYPLTISDHVSRFLLGCEGLGGNKSDETQAIFEEVFREYGVPYSIRSDNGEPFSSRSIWGLSSLSVWWLRLGIRLERIRPGHPEENGRHERMHRTLKQETTKPPGKNLLQQQEKLNNFVFEYNYERPHEGLKMKTPGEVYKKAERKYPSDLPDVDYSDQDEVKIVSQCGSISIGNKKRVFISQSFRGQPLGITEIEGGVWEVNFMDYKLGYFDKEDRILSIAESPFIEKLT